MIRPVFRLFHQAILDGIFPKIKPLLVITFSASQLAIEEITPGDVPQWDSQSFEAARTFGDRWYDERRTPVLVVPSVVTRVERIILINQQHPGSVRIRASQPQPVRWDARLWEAQ